MLTTTLLRAAEVVLLLLLLNICHKYITSPAGQSPLADHYTGL